jgi:ectoine hydroxylase-related dioxygenase (phytanoyl-CoA dioxygenase family)
LKDQPGADLASNGFTVIPGIYTAAEIDTILSVIKSVDTNRDTFRKTADLFAIRQFLKEVPEVLPLIFNAKLRLTLSQFFRDRYFVVKSIYFDKPETSNWYVAYHQDLTISVDKRVDLPGFGPWTAKQNQFAVQPPISILENIHTIRIHLDSTTKQNGALKVITGSHTKGIYRPETINWNVENEVFCDVPKGGIMIMKPLLLHGSNRTVNHARRRVIHIEFANKQLPDELAWAELINF